ncbi:protein kinase-like protein [Leishmania mexicana MHOM/GT/2001/U1103]|uniref:Protein kinase-like protein n=1 Tax=Leishmania mexicana (strain MHOM/GT/2001/U1103) TaxID=929439 RepID=E9B663_LEIMU|nr:protein kinase-like protein [Leishmania mexicana MHOM/GT/2001/U1103]CBZ30734.1 protein kinase-like protein [Leishmania mexicana MHOM/GT/2001/U1103]
MPMGANASGGPSFQNGANRTGNGTTHKNGMPINGIQNSSMMEGRNEVTVKSAGNSVTQRVANLPTLPATSASMQGLQSEFYSMPPPPMMHAGFQNGTMMLAYSGGNRQLSANGVRGTYRELNEMVNGDKVSTVQADDGKMRDADSVTPSLSPNNNAQNGCNVNTPLLAQADEYTGLTPTPPSLRFLTSYEEEEVKDYLPSVYFSGTEQCKKIHGVRGTEKNDGYDDGNFHYRVVVGDHLLYRYEVVKVLGQGTFGVVVRALDHKHHRLVAVKVIKNKPNYTKQAREEIKTLELLNRDDPDDEANIVRLLGSHIFRRHYILVFELLPSDLYAIIQTNKFRHMSHDFIYELSEQLLTALVHVRDHNIVHCDLKPENIMISPRGGHSNSLSVSSDFSLKLIDFGSACEESRPLFTYIQSRYYRAPEIVLGIPYTTAIDMWSFGCVLCELANGYPIFPASSEGELLERIVEYFGTIPSYLVRQGRRADRFFEDGQMKYNLGKKRVPHSPHSRALRNFLKIGRSHEEQLFEDFVSKCMHLDARQRLTPEAALEHPWMEFWRGTSSSGDTASLSDSCSLSR